MASIKSAVHLARANRKLARHSLLLQPRKVYETLKYLHGLTHYLYVYFLKKKRDI